MDEQVSVRLPAAPGCQPTASAVPASQSGIPSAASFAIGTYADGSGPKVRVRYDTTAQFAPDRVWIDGGDYSDHWIAVDPDIAEELCKAILTAAQAIEARQEQGK